MAHQELTYERLKYLQLLAEQFQSPQALKTEIIYLRSLLSLPKGTEHFMSDIHGEYESFCHIMNNCSGVIREKVDMWLGENMTRAEMNEFCTLIYYPKEKLKQLESEGVTTPEWYLGVIHNLVTVARKLSAKYTRAKVRRAIPEEYRFVIDELLHPQAEEDFDFDSDKDGEAVYRRTILDSVVETGAENELIEALSQLIKFLAVDRLHVVGDIFDRGSRADSIMDILMNHHSIDIEWGNHDILWMGAASGSQVCIAGVVRNCLSYNNTEILERGYGIPLRSVTELAEQLYPDLPKDKAALYTITIIMFKLEGQLIMRNPDFLMDDRLLLHKLDIENHTVTFREKTWETKDIPMPTFNKSSPYSLSDEEKRVIDNLTDSFLQSVRLHSHVAFLLKRGWLYRSFNGNLLFHGCIPMNEDGSLTRMKFGGKEYEGRELMDYEDQMARQSFYTHSQRALDFMWYLWCGTTSPLCGREITTFARFFIADQGSWAEPRNPYYRFSNEEECCRRLLGIFGLDPEYGHIVNGHTPIRFTHGESPLKAGGKLIVIDGGFCKAYQKTTGIAGYTLISNSHGIRLMSHQPFTSKEDAIKNGSDIHSQSFAFTTFPERLRVCHTDHGKRLQERVRDLEDLLEAVKDGSINLEGESAIMRRTTEEMQK